MVSLRPLGFRGDTLRSAGCWPGSQEPRKAPSEPLRGRVSSPGLGLRMSRGSCKEAPRDSLESGEGRAEPCLYSSPGDIPTGTVNPNSPRQGIKGHLDSKPSPMCTGCPHLCTCCLHPPVPPSRGGLWGTQQSRSKPHSATSLLCGLRYACNVSELVYPSVKWGFQLTSWTCY